MAAKSSFTEYFARKEKIPMRKIVSTNPENTRNYLKPNDRKTLLIMVGIKLVLAIIGTFLMRIGEYPILATILLRILMFAFVYDICCLYQVCLHIAQSIFISFLLFLVMLLGAVFIFNYFFSFLAAFNPATEAGQNLSMLAMIFIFLIPFSIDAVRLAKLSANGRTTAR